jgi:hypothetical protein
VPTGSISPIIRAVGSGMGLMAKHRANTKISMKKNLKNDLLRQANVPQIRLPTTKYKKLWSSSCTISSITTDISRNKRSGRRILKNICYVVIIRNKVKRYL